MDTRIPDSQDPQHRSSYRPLKSPEAPKKKAFVKPTLGYLGSVPRITGGTDIFGDRE